MDTAAAALCDRVAALSICMFQLDKAHKKALKTKGGRRGHLMLWGVGYQSGSLREQFHHVVGAAAADIVWPEGDLQELALQMVQLLEGIARRGLELLGGEPLV